MPVDYLLGAYRGLKSLVLADPWLSRPLGGGKFGPNQANGVRSFTWNDEAVGDNYPGPKQPSRDPAGLVSVALEIVSMTDEGRGVGRGGTPTFGNQSSAGCPYVGTMTAEFEWVVVGQDKRLVAKVLNVEHSMTAVATRLLFVLGASPNVDVSGGTNAEGQLGRSSLRSEVTNRGPDAGGTLRRIFRVRTPLVITYRGPQT